MSNYIKCDASYIVGSIFQYSDETGKNVNFYYTSDNDYFTMYLNQIPVCFKFKDIKSSKDVEVYVPSEYKYEFDYDLMFGKLRQMLIEFPIVQFIKDAFPLDNKKLDFIRDNCESVSIVEIEDGLLMLDVKLSDLELKTGIVFSGESNVDMKDDEVLLYDMYNKLIAKLDECFYDSGLAVLISSEVSKSDGLKFYVTDEDIKSSVAGVYLGSNGECIISNFYLSGNLVNYNKIIIQCLENLNELEFVNKIVYNTSVDNKTYTTLGRMGYSTTTGLLVPKSMMYKQFV